MGAHEDIRGISIVLWCLLPNVLPVTVQPVIPFPVLQSLLSRGAFEWPLFFAPFEMTIQWFAVRAASAWQRIIDILLVSSEYMSTGCRGQVRRPTDKGARRCEARSPERTLLLRTHSRGQSLRGERERPNLGERTGRCVCMSQFHWGEAGAQSSTPHSLC